MSDRWVIPWLFRAQVALVNWTQEISRLHYDGPVLQTGQNAPPVQLRLFAAWLEVPQWGRRRHLRTSCGNPLTGSMGEHNDHTSVATQVPRVPGKPPIWEIFRHVGDCWI